MRTDSQGSISRWCISRAGWSPIAARYRRTNTTTYRTYIGKLRQTTVSYSSTRGFKQKERSNIMKTLMGYWKDEEGLTTVEYALLLALIVVVAITAWTALGTGVNSTVDDVKDTLP